jgi:Flp pilus assembly protein TadG
MGSPEQSGRRRAVRGPRRGRRAALAQDRDADRGSSAIELAIFGFVIIFASMLLVEYGLWFEARHAALAAAQQGDLVARENAFTDQQGWKSLAATAAHSYYLGLDTGVLSGVTATAYPGGQPDTVTVELKGSLNAVISLPIDVTVTGPVECFRTDVSQGTACG